MTAQMITVGESTSSSLWLYDSIYLTLQYRLGAGRSLAIERGDSGVDDGYAEWMRLEAFLVRYSPLSGS